MFLYPFRSDFSVLRPKDKTAPFQGLRFVVQKYRLIVKKATFARCFFDKFSTFPNNRTHRRVRATLGRRIFRKLFFPPDFRVIHHPAFGMRHRSFRATRHRNFRAMRHCAPHRPISPTLSTRSAPRMLYFCTDFGSRNVSSTTRRTIFARWRSLTI